MSPVPNRCSLTAARHTPALLISGAHVAQPTLANSEMSLQRILLECLAENLTF